MDKLYQSIEITRGSSGYGGPLTIAPTAQRNKILCITGGGIHPLARKIAAMTGAEAVDGFKVSVPDEEVAAVVIDCGGTARAGVYPKKGLLTLNVLSAGKVGPLARYITEDLYVSDVREENLQFKSAVLKVEAGENVKEDTKEDAKETIIEETAGNQDEKNKPYRCLTTIGRKMGSVVDIFYQAGREAIDIVLKNILPFMAFVSLIVGLITSTGIGTSLAKILLPLVSTLPGMVAIALFCSMPFLSPLLGPGAVVAQVVGVLIGVEIGRGTIPAQLALPALFAINAQVGADFIPVGLSLGEADKNTIEAGVPAILISRLITGPLAVILAYLASVGLYT